MFVTCKRELYVCKYDLVTSSMYALDKRILDQIATVQYCIPRKYNVPLIITNLTSALNSLKFLVVNVLRYAHAHVKHVKNRYHKGTLKWQD